MSYDAGTEQLGPDDGSLLVKTYRQGMASKAGHDLILEVAQWNARVRLEPDSTSSEIVLSAEPHSLRVREGVGGVKPLSDRDREEIRSQIDKKVLTGQPISFRSTSVRADEAAGRLDVSGELTIGTTARPVEAQLQLDPDGRVSGTIPLTQSAWGIKPYRGLMGALKVRDDVDIVIDVRLPAA